MFILVLQREVSHDYDNVLFFFNFDHSMKKQTLQTVRRTLDRQQI